MDATITLEPGDLFVLYSDGITESMNERSEQFTLSRLCKIIEYRASRPCEVEQIVDAILSAVAEWQTRQVDDQTVVVVRRSDSPGRVWSS